MQADGPQGKHEGGLTGGFVMPHIRITAVAFIVVGWPCSPKGPRQSWHSMLQQWWWQRWRQRPDSSPLEQHGLSRINKRVGIDAHMPMPVIERERYVKEGVSLELWPPDET